MKCEKNHIDKDSGGRVGRVEEPQKDLVWGGGVVRRASVGSLCNLRLEYKKSGLKK